MTCPVIVLTGGPGGGKTTFIKELIDDSAWHGEFLALPEAIFVAAQVGISPREQLFQRLMVEIQHGLENSLKRALAPTAPRFILCHRGTLDPLAYWLDCGWPEADFFTFTDIVDYENHYRRYQAVIHLVTAADGAVSHYTRWPQAHRHEQVEDAIRLDRLLHRIWKNHPHYYRIDNVNRDWPAKAQLAREFLNKVVTT